MRGRTALATAVAAAILPLALWACAGSEWPPATAPVAVPTPPPTPKVLVVSVDGLRPDALQSAEAASIRDLARRGAFSWQAQTVFPPMTLNAHGSMLTGADPAEHRLNWNEYEPARGYVVPATVFTVAKAAGLRTAMVVGKEKLRHLATPGTVDRFVCTQRGDGDVANEAIVQVLAGFDLLFVHFPDTDLAGHASGWMSKAYLAKVADLDAALGRLLSVLPAETTVILSADHGGLGTTHGSRIPQDMTIPWIIAGPRARGGRQLATAINTRDTAATALYVLGLPRPASMAGSVVVEAFEAATP